MRIKESEAFKSYTETDYRDLIETLSSTIVSIKEESNNFGKGKQAFFNMLEDLHDSYTELEHLFIGLVKAMVNALDAKSHWTKGHSDRVARYAEHIARGFDFDDEDIKNLRLAGLLHDIGKIGTYDYLLDKPSKLTDGEYSLVKKHPVQGAQIIEGIRQLNNIVPIIMYHHERVDGKGYPDGLKGEDIPVCARILHVADSYDSMTSSRPYRNAPGKEYAISELKINAGSQFDREIVDVFLKALHSYNIPLA